MIRINLHTSKNQKVKGSNSPGRVLDLSDGQRNAELAKRAVYLAVIPLALFFYEREMIPKKKETFTGLQKSLSELAAFNNKREETRTKIKSRKQEYEKYETQLNALKKVSQSRFFELKILDRLQDIMPEHTWVTEVRFRKDSSAGGPTNEKNPMKQEIEIKLSTAVETEADKLFETISSQTDFFEEVIPSFDRVARTDNAKIKDFGFTIRIKKELSGIGTSAAAASSTPASSVTSPSPATSMAPQPSSANDKKEKK